MTNLFKHFKGGLYVRLLEGVTASCDIKEGEHVYVYLSLQDGGLYVRSKTNFHQPVKTEDHLLVGPLRFEPMGIVEGMNEMQKRLIKLGLDHVYGLNVYVSGPKHKKVKKLPKKRAKR